MDYRTLASAERLDLARFLAKLTDEQWQTPSLCAGWTVRDVVAHMFSYEHLSRADTAKRLLKGLRHPGGPNGVGLDEFADHSNADLAALAFESVEPRGLTTSFGCGVALADGLIHHQDIRRPLGLPREIPEERLRVVLDFARFAPPLRGIVRTYGLRLVASDIDWTFGRGPEVRGRGEALLMAMVGRSGITRELTGDGVEKLAGRVG